VLRKQPSEPFIDPISERRPWHVPERHRIDEISRLVNDSPVKHGVDDAT